MASMIHQTNQLLFQATPKPTETLAEAESSKDSEKTMIFSRPKPKAPPKPSAGRKKGAIGKKAPQKKPPKETTTSTSGPSNKGKGKEDLSIPDDQVQDEPKDLLVE